MAERSRTRIVLWVACALFMWPWAAAQADDVPLVTGRHWTQSSDQVKKAYLFGMANVLQLEGAYNAGNPPPDTQSILPRAARGLRNQTLDTVRSTLDRWYAAHPDQLERPVIETIWFEIVVPGLKS
jgi:hypothetical protein